MRRRAGWTIAFSSAVRLSRPLTHPVPRSSASWWYVFGSATFTVLILQFVTGLCLATVYAPTADKAWQSLIYLNYDQPLGWFIRALHGWGSNFMVGLVCIHMAQVFLFGAHKYPRELTWIAGVVLLLGTLGMAFTGQVLRFDQDAYWGLGIGAAIAGRTPFIGPKVVDMILGGPIIAGETLSRFFTLHVFVIPGLIISFVGLHLYLVLRLGINEWPMPGRIVKPRHLYRSSIMTLVQKDGEPFFPYAAQKDLVFAGLIILALVVTAAVMGPIGPNGEPDPAIIQTVPRPDFFFLWLFSVFALLPPWTETVLMLTGPVAAIGLLFLVPFISGTGEKSTARRPITVMILVLTFMSHRDPDLSRNILAVVAAYGSMERNADPGGRCPRAHAAGVAGRGEIQAKQCRNCHSLGGQGGERGPALDTPPPALPRIRLCAKSCKAAATCRLMDKTSVRRRSTPWWPSWKPCIRPSEPPARNSTRPASPASEQAPAGAAGAQ